jgi:hypothetical protein
MVSSGVLIPRGPHQSASCSASVQLGEPVEAALPELRMAGEPSEGLAQRIRPQPARAALRLTAALYQPRALEHLHVLGDRGQGHAEGLGKLADGCLAGGQAREDRPPRRVGEGGEDAVELGGGHAGKPGGYLTERLTLANPAR